LVEIVPALLRYVANGQLFEAYRKEATLPLPVALSGAPPYAYSCGFDE